MGREENVKIFEDTERAYKSNPVLKEAVRASVKQQIMIPEGADIAELFREHDTDFKEHLMEPDEMDSLKDTLEAVNSDPGIVYGKESGEDSGNRDGGKAFVENRENGTSVSKKKSHKATVLVSDKRTLQAAGGYRGKRIAVHNFASATNPGGGVTRGSSAQEEALCRCSTLFPCLNTSELWNAFYQKHRQLHDAVYNDDLIYTPNVIAFKTDTSSPRMMAEKDWYSVNVITCAAPNLREKPSNAMNPQAGTNRVILSDQELLEVHIKRGRRIFETAKQTGNEVLILGAFGCGAFRNPPEIVAKAYKTLLNEYRDDFETIEFAVYCPPKDDRNYQVFRKTILF